MYIDKKYISLLAPKLQQFKVRGDSLWNFRCPVCNDSHKDKLKARGYIYNKKDLFFFMCHNCGSSMKLSSFIKFVDPALYDDYQLESFVNKNPDKSSVELKALNFISKPKFESKSKCVLNTEHLVRIKSLPLEFYARKYLEDRKVPLKDLYFTSDFAQYVQSQFPSNTKKLYKEPRIVIPFYDNENNLLGVQGRSIGPSKIKYITIKAAEHVPKIFGWNKVDTQKVVYVVEGPIDSLFISNCVATMDATLYDVVSVLGVDVNYVFVYDAEPRNKQIVSNMRKTIDRGYKVCIWPEYIKEKDINEMILSGRSGAEIQHIIDKNSYEGVMATMMMNQWEKTA